MMLNKDPKMKGLCLEFIKHAGSVDLDLKYHGIDALDLEIDLEIEAKVLLDHETSKTAETLDNNDNDPVPAKK